MNCAMQEEESTSYSFHVCSAACYFCLFSCLIRGAILWNPRNSPAVTVISRDGGDGAGKRITEAQIQCAAPWAWRVAQVTPWVTLAVWWEHCLPVWANLASGRSLCHWCLALCRGAGCCSQVLSRLWGLTIQVMVPSWPQQWIQWSGFLNALDPMMSGNVLN